MEILDEDDTEEIKEVPRDLQTVPTNNLYWNNIVPSYVLDVQEKSKGRRE